MKDGGVPLVPEPVGVQARVGKPWCDQVDDDDDDQQTRWTFRPRVWCFVNMHVHVHLSLSLSIQPALPGRAEHVPTTYSIAEVVYRYTRGLQPCSRMHMSVPPKSPLSQFTLPPR